MISRNNHKVAHIYLFDAYSKVSKTAAIAIKAKKKAASLKKEIDAYHRKLLKYEDIILDLRVPRTAALDEAKQGWEYARKCKAVLHEGMYTIEMLEEELAQTEEEVEQMTRQVQLNEERQEQGGERCKFCDIKENSDNSMAQCETNKQSNLSSFVASLRVAPLAQQLLHQRVTKLEKENAELQKQLLLYKTNARGKSSAHHHLSNAM